MTKSWGMLILYTATALVWLTLLALSVEQLVFTSDNLFIWLIAIYALLAVSHGIEAISEVRRPFSKK